MNRLRAYGLLLLVLITSGIVQLHSQGTANGPRRIAVFGSSVAFGTGDSSTKKATRDCCVQCWRRAAGKC